MFGFGGSSDEDEPRDVSGLTRQYAAERMAQGEQFSGRRIAHANAMGVALTAAQRATIAAKVEEVQQQEQQKEQEEREEREAARAASAGAGAGAAAAASATEPTAAAAAAAAAAPACAKQPVQQLAEAVGSSLSLAAASGTAAGEAVAASAGAGGGGGSGSGNGGAGASDGMGRFKRLAMGVRAGTRLALVGGVVAAPALLPAGAASAVLDGAMLRALARSLPTRLARRPWRLRFAMRLHGASLPSLLASERGGGGHGGAATTDHVLALRAGSGARVGGFVAAAAIGPHASPEFIGGGESFVFSFPGGSAERCDVFGSTGRNGMVLLASGRHLGMGGGGGGFAWCVDDAFERISSSAGSETFGNDAGPLLALEPAQGCVCEEIEVWEVT